MLCFFNLERNTIMLGLGISLNKKKAPSGSSYTPEYQAILDYASGAAITLPSEGQQVLQDAFVQELISAGVWSKLDGLWVFATESEGFSRINWKSPGNYTLITTNNFPTFTSNVGITQNGSNMSVRALDFFTNNASNYTQGNASVVLHVHTRNTNNDSDIQATQYMFFGTSFFNLYRMRLNSSQDNSISNSGNTTGFFQFDKGASYKLYRNGVDLGLAFTQTNNFRATGSLSTSTTSNGTFSLLAAGASLQDEAADFYTAWNNYRASI